MKKNRYLPHLVAVLLLTSGLWSAPAAAQDKIELTSKAQVEVTTANERGEKVVRLEPATKVLPGQVVVFTNTYVNAGDEAAENVVIRNPVPEHMTYIDGSAFGEGMEIEFSIDGGETFAPADALTVADPSGRMWPAAPEEYTHIRWTLKEPLAPQAQGEVGFRARLK